MSSLLYPGCAAFFVLLVAFGSCLAAEGGPPVSEDTVLTGQGLLGLNTGTSTCLEGTHDLTNPCSGFQTILLDSFFSSVPLDNYLCQYVKVSGPDVGIECPDIGVETLALVQPPACIANLSVFDGASTWLQWPTRQCATSYDIIRGVLPDQRPSAGWSISEPWFVWPTISWSRLDRFLPRCSARAMGTLRRSASRSFT